MSSSRSLLLAIVGIGFALAKDVHGGDWPQILGQGRNGKAVGERLLETWPAGGPNVLWRSRLGSGYAGPAVIGSRVLVFHRVGESERVE